MEELIARVVAAAYQSAAGILDCRLRFTPRIVLGLKLSTFSQNLQQVDAIPAFLAHDAATIRIACSTTLR